METEITQRAPGRETAEQRAETGTAATTTIISHEVASEGRDRNHQQREIVRSTQPQALNADGLPRRTQTRTLEAGACPALAALHGSA